MESAQALALEPNLSVEQKTALFRLLLSPDTAPFQTLASKEFTGLLVKHYQLIYKVCFLLYTGTLSEPTQEEPAALEARAWKRAQDYLEASLSGSSILDCQLRAYLPTWIQQGSLFSLEHLKQPSGSSPPKTQTLTQLNAAVTQAIAVQQQDYDSGLRDLEGPYKIFSEAHAAYAQWKSIGPSQVTWQRTLSPLMLTPALINQPNAQGHTLAHYLVHQGLTQALTWAVALGANLTVRTSTGLMPAHCFGAGESAGSMRAYLAGALGLPLSLFQELASTNGFLPDTFLGDLAQALAPRAGSGAPVLSGSASVTFLAQMALRRGSSGLLLGLHRQDPQRLTSIVRGCMAYLRAETRADRASGEALQALATLMRQVEVPASLEACSGWGEAPASLRKLFLNWWQHLSKKEISYRARLSKLQPQEQKKALNESEQARKSVLQHRLADISLLTQLMRLCLCCPQVLGLGLELTELLNHWSRHLGGGRQKSTLYGSAGFFGSGLKQMAATFRKAPDVRRLLAQPQEAFPIPYSDSALRTLAEKDAEIAALSVLAQTKSTEVQALNGRIVTLQTALVAEQGTVDQQQAELQHQQAMLAYQEGVMQEYKASAAQSEAEKKRLALSVRAKDEEIDALRLDKQSLQQTVYDLNDQLASVTEKVNEQARQFSEQQAFNRRQEEKNQAAEARACQAEQKAATAESEAARAHEELKTQSEELRTQSEKIKTQEEALASVFRILAKVQGQLEQTDEKLALAEQQEQQQLKASVVLSKPVAPYLNQGLDSAVASGVNRQQWGEGSLPGGRAHVSKKAPCS